MTKTITNIGVNQRSLSVEHDERRVYELGFGNPDKNFRNYKFFTIDMHVWGIRTLCPIRGMTFLIR